MGVYAALKDNNEYLYRADARLCLGELRVHTFMIVAFIGVCGVWMLHVADGFGSMEAASEN
jgi:hypothetical protein